MVNEWLIPLLAGYLLDTLFGDPRFLPHPIRWFGSAIAYFEKRLNTSKNRRLKGVLTTVVLIIATWAILYGIQHLLQPYKIARIIFDTILVFYGLACHSLIFEAIKVERKLSHLGLEAGRKRLSFIVGRDTSPLNENQIRTSVLETLAENLCDGVIAPLFFFFAGGVPLMLAYKMVNTLDSMIGYKSDRYKDFGWFAAKTDDIFNYLPARITAFLMVLIAHSSNGLRFIFKYGRKHASPNSGYPESALAGILNCRFGGPNLYHGVLVEKPYIGINDREIKTQDVYFACKLNYACSVMMVLLIVGVICMAGL